MEFYIADKHLAELDKSEDMPEEYERIAVKVHKCATSVFGNQSPCIAEAWVYVGQAPYVTAEHSPDPDYVDLLVKAANDRSFPEEYIDNYLTYSDELAEKAI